MLLTGAEGHVGTTIALSVRTGNGPALDFALDHADRIDAVGLMNSFYASSPVVKLPELIALFAEPSLRQLAMAILMDPKQLIWPLDFQNRGFQVHMSEAQKRGFDEIIQPIFRANFSQQPSAAGAFARMTAQTHPAMSANTSRLTVLKEATFPVTLVWGAQDPYLGLPVAEEIASQLRRTQIIPIEAGHWPQIDAPEAVAYGIAVSASFSSSTSIRQ